MLLLVDVSGYLSQVQYILSPLFGIGPVGLVVRRRGQQDHPAFVLLNVVLNDPVALAFAVAQVVALIDQDKAKAFEVREFA